MQDVKIYIVIENLKTKQEVNIKGSLELLGAFMKEIANIEPSQLDTQYSVVVPPIQEPQP